MKDLSDMTPDEKRQLLFALLEGTVGPVPLAENSNVWLVPIYSDPVDPEKTATIVSRCEALFRPRRLVIFEPEYECVEKTVVEEPVKESGLSLFQRERIHYSSRTEYRKSLRRVPRGVWEISSVLVGNLIQFPTHARLCGDLFGLTNDMQFAGDLCLPGMSITMQVRHSLSDSVVFRGVVLGDRVLHPQEKP